MWRRFLSVHLVNGGREHPYSCPLSCSRSHQPRGNRCTWPYRASLQRSVRESRKRNRRQAPGRELTFQRCFQSLFSRGHSNHHDIDLAPEVELRSEEHTSELQSQSNLVCRLLLEKKKTIYSDTVSLTHTPLINHYALAPINTNA